MHRDIKLDNFMINKSNQIKIIDFGFSKKLMFKTDRTRTILGSPMFQDP